MFHFGSDSPKPHLGLANSKWIAKFNRGPLKGWKAHMNKDRPTTVHYQSRDGKKRWHGSKHLKGTQSMPQLFKSMCWISCSKMVNLSKTIKTWWTYFYATLGPEAIPRRIWQDDQQFDAAPFGWVHRLAILPGGRNCPNYFPVSSVSMGRWLWHVQGL